MPSYRSVDRVFPGGTQTAAVVAAHFWRGADARVVIGADEQAMGWV